MFSILVGVATAVCHLIGSCWLIVAFVEDISIELPTLNADDDEESCPNEREWIERLNNIIQLHSHVKQLSEIQAEIELKNYITFSLFSDFGELSMKFMNSKLCSSTCIRTRAFVPPFSYY